ncbi:DUF4411 family protein [Methylocella silvestris]|uniref:DNA-binding protein n=1 Tax=Methylocella silvestris TaxID=199596 RepID=A0A2J7TI95_METSI|nr:DUF4411 family protein [Methylocella silvestris]PNG26476.1 DNA-binding protein [Methylocella silvestris]
MHLLDANVLIRAHEDYYGIDQVPQFWDWLLAQAAANLVKMPLEIHQEIAISKGPLREWVCATSVKQHFVLDEEVDQDLVEHVLATGYGPNLTDSELEKVGQDPFLVAYGLAREGRFVVTKEVSAPSKQRANRKVPDVCNSVGVSWMRDFDLYKALGFSTK